MTDTYYQSDMDIPNSYVSKGISDDAIKISELFRKFREKIFLDNITLGEPRKEALGALENIYKECSINNWDGYGSVSINIHSYNNARKLIETLPISIPIPEATIDPDGNIAFEWYRSQSKIFTLCLEGYNKIIFAGIFGNKRIHGTEDFDRDIPDLILYNIKRVYK
ncbi:hypothetical protein HY745_08305 [Candidatus Desantisbacteria bacterium]|nr:hypothetical protein [Candidatus Desantisbacteria bacterium]